MKEFFLICYVGIGNDFARGLYPGLDIGPRVAYGPVAAPDHAIPTEAFDAVFNIRAYCFGGGISLGAIGEDARDFACDIGQGGYLRDVVTPGICCVVCNVRYAAVVEDELDLWTFLREVAGDGELVGAEAEVEGEVVFFEEADVIREVVRLGEVVGHGVQDAAEADEFGVLNRFDVGFKSRGRFGTAVGDDAFDYGIGLFG